MDARFAVSLQIQLLRAACPRRMARSDQQGQEVVGVALTDNWLSNRVFKGYDDIVAHCCDAWNELMDQPWRITSIGRREWAEGF